MTVKLSKSFLLYTFATIVASTVVYQLLSLEKNNLSSPDEKKIKPDSVILHKGLRGDENAKNKKARTPSSTSINHGFKEVVSDGNHIYETHASSQYQTKEEQEEQLERIERKSPAQENQNLSQNENSPQRNPAYAFDSSEDTVTDNGQLPDSQEVLEAQGYSSSDTINGNKDETNTSDTTGGGSRTDKVKVDARPIIQGKIPPLMGLISYDYSNKFFSKAYAAGATSCTNPRITLFDINTMSILADNPITEDQLTTTTIFEFDPNSLALDIKIPTKYLLKTSGCDVSYERIVTSFYSDQNLTPTTTLVSKIIKSSATIDLTNIDAQKVVSLIKAIDEKITPGDSIDTSYQMVELDSSAQQQFADAFAGENYQILADVAPDVEQIIIPSSLQEKVAAIFSTTALHWNPNYEIAYEWHIDNVKLSNAPNFSYTPSANSKRTISVKLLIGKAVSGIGTDIDITHPYHEVNYTLNISNDIITTAPNIALDSSSTNPTNTPTIFINLATGNDLGSGQYENCESFSNFAITENSQTPVDSDFTYTCTTATQQIFDYTLTSSDGDVEVNIWARDINGEISSKKTFIVNLDTQAPAITIASLPDTYRADTSITLSWSILEANQTSLNEHEIEFFDGTSWNTLPTVASADGFINNQNFQTSYLLPNIQVSNAKFRVSLMDSIGNLSSSESEEFAILKPILAISPISQNFGNILNNSVGTNNLFTITNNGDAATKECSLVDITGAQASQFQIVTDNCNTSTLGPALNCDFAIRAIPSSKGAKSATAIWECGLDSISANLSYTAINNAPTTPADYNLSTNEDTVLNFTATSGSDIDSDALTYSITSSPSNGVLTNCMASNNDLTCTYTPNLNFNGTDSFSYIANDGAVNAVSAVTVTITVNPINDAPTLTSTQTINVTEDTPLNFNLNSGSDIDLNTLTYIITENPAIGNLSCTGGTSTSCTYTPVLDDINSYTFKYKVNDGNTDSPEATVTILINNTNDAPVMVGDQAISTNEDTLVNFTLSGATDIDPAQTLSYKLITGPANGVLSNCINTGSYLTDISCTYTPNLNFNGTDSFTYRANDALTDSPTFSTVTITVSPINDAPTLSTPQAFATNEDTVLNFNLGLGSDVDADTLTYIKLSNPASGTLTCTGGISRACVYTPALNFNGVASFTYKVNDGALDSNTATVNITVNPINDAPTLASPQSFATNEDTVLNFNLGLGSDIEGSTLTYLKLTNPASGVVTCTGGTSRACVFTPASNYNGLVSFTYKVNDGSLDSNTATVNITVNPINDAPTLVSPQSFATNEDTVLNFNLGIGSDIDGDTLTYIKLTNPASGALTCTGGTSRACVYTPALNFNGITSFTYKVNDGALDSNTATVNITVNAVNDRPVMAANQNFTTDDNINYNFTISNATDVDGDSLSYKIISTPANGAITNCITTGVYGTDLTCTYRSNANFNGTDSFTYIANDGTIDALTTATITFTVNDKTPPSAPLITLAHSQYRNVLGQNLTASSCTDISQIFINESTQPSAGAAGWQNCTTTAAALTYTLAAATEGTHNLKVWSKDAYGNVSTVATNIVVIYDVTLPVISVTNPGLQRGNNTISVGWSVTETNISAAQNHTVQYFNGTSWVNITTTKAASAGPLSATNFTQSWTTPTLNRSDIKIRVILSDLAGNTRTSDSTVFTIDSTAPVLTITSPAANSYHQTSLTLTGACETGLAINFSGNIPANFSQTCSGGTYSQLVNLDSGDGNKTITVTQTDAAGNITTVTRIFIRDEIAPVLTKTTGASPDFTRFNQPNAWGGTCEGNYTINVTGSQTTSFACSSGSWSWTAGSKTVDGVYNYNLVQTDGAGNTSSPPLSLSWQRDATAPVFNATTPVAINAGQNITITNNLNTFSIGGNCEGTNAIVITGSASATFSCSASSWSWNVPSVAVDGTRNFTFTQTDSAGNTSTFTMNHTRDTTGPALTIATNIVKSNQDTVTYSGTCETGLTINVTGSQTSSTTCPAGTWSWTSASQTTDATRNFTFTQAFTVTPFNSTAVAGQWIRETNLPTISLFTTSASNPSRSAFIPINLNATSQNSAVYIKSFCIRSDDSTAPIIGDECWLDVNSPTVGKALAQTLSLTGHPNLLGWTPKDYDVFVWVLDEAGNSSALTSAGAGTIGTDRIDIGYDPGIPPTVWDVLAANDPNATLPPTRAQSSSAAGNDLYIRWKANDNLALPAGAITLYYTPDEINFTQIVAGLNNANYSCGAITLAANEGCYKWTGGSPLNTSYKVQVKATDAGDISTQLVSNPINSDMLKIIAGNTESGLGGSAQTAMFYTRKNDSEADPGTLVVTNDGRFYVADYKRGIITIDPNDGKQKIFIPATGTSSGDGGPAVNATLRYATKIALDYQGRLLILDTNLIRRVDLNQSTPSIETIIGGGASTADTVANPRDVQIYTHSTNSYTSRMLVFFATPNGDIYFQSDYGLFSPTNSGLRVRIYKAATNQVESIRLTGYGDFYDNTTDLTKCRLLHAGLRFDPSNSQITGVTATTYRHYSYTDCDNNPAATDGDRYSISYFDPTTFEAITPLDGWAPYSVYYNKTNMDGNVYKFIYRDYVNRINFDGTSTRLVGSGTRGYCVDGTPAVSCNMDIQDVYITATGKIYLLEGGQIRTVNEDGNMVTLFGQRRSYGDGINALNARFDSINTVKRLDNGKIIVGDASSYYIKEFTTEGDVNVIAGNGNYKSGPDTTNPVTSQGLYDTSWIVADKANGEVYMRTSTYGRVLKFNRSTNLWEIVIGCGATDFWNADGMTGVNTRCSGYSNMILPIGFDGQNLLASRMRHNTVEDHYEDFMFKLYDSTNNYTQSHIAGTNGAETYTGGYYGICTSGSTAADCKMPYYSYMGQPSWDAANARWIFIREKTHSTYGREIWSMKQGGTVDHIATTPRRAYYGYTYHKASGVEYLYYCNENGRIYKHNITTNTDLGMLTWPVETLYCRGLSLEYNPTNNSLIFPFEQNGLYGVGEYFLP